MAQFLDPSSVPHDYWSIAKRPVNPNIAAAYAPRQPRRDAYGRVIGPDGRPVDDSPQLPNWLQEYIADSKAKTEEANAANEYRYGRAEQLLGLRDDSGRPTFGSYGQPASAASGSAASGSASIGGQNQFGGGSGPIYAPQTGAVKQDNVSRGIYNTSGGLNTESVTNSLALSAAQDAEFNRQQRVLDRSDRVLDRQLDLLRSKDDVAPDMNTVYQLAAEYGRGDTSGLDEEAFAGGGGGGGAPAFINPQSAGYRLPTVGFGSPGGYRYGASRSKPSNFDTAAAIRSSRQLFNNKLRGGYGSVSTPVKALYGPSAAMPSVDTSIRPTMGAGMGRSAQPADNPFVDFHNYVNSYYQNRRQPVTSIYR